jgi:hypothetical protein
MRDLIGWVLRWFGRGRLAARDFPGGNEAFVTQKRRAANPELVSRQLFIEARTRQILNPFINTAALAQLRERRAVVSFAGHQAVAIAPAHQAEAETEQVQAASPEKDGRAIIITQERRAVVPHRNRWIVADGDSNC